MSLEIAGGATLVVLLVALPAAYYTSRHRFRGRAAFLILVLATQMLQPTALIVGIYKEFLDFGLLNLNPASTRWTGRTCSAPPSWPPSRCSCCSP